MYASSHLLVVSVIGSKKSVALAVYSWSSAATNCIHFPVGVVIVHHMEITMPTSANKFNKTHLKSNSFSYYNWVINWVVKQNSFMNSINYLGILCTSPSPKWLKAIVTCMSLSFV